MLELQIQGPNTDLSEILEVESNNLDLTNLQVILIILKFVNHCFKTLLTYRFEISKPKSSPFIFSGKINTTGLSLCLIP